MLSTGSAGTSQWVRLNRLVRLVRLTKLLRIFRLYRLSQSRSSWGAALEQNLNPSTLRLLLLIFVVLSILNGLSCVYWIVVSFQWEDIGDQMRAALATAPPTNA